MKLSQEQLEELADLVAEKVLSRISEKFYQQVGRNALDRARMKLTVLRGQIDNVVKELD